MSWNSTTTINSHWSFPNWALIAILFAQITGHVFKSLCERHRSRAQRFSGFTAFEVGWTYLASKSLKEDANCWDPLFASILLALKPSKRVYCRHPILASHFSHLHWEMKNVKTSSILKPTRFVRSTRDDSGWPNFSPSIFTKHETSSIRTPSPCHSSRSISTHRAFARLRPRNVPKVHRSRVDVAQCRTFGVRLTALWGMLLIGP